MKKKIAFIPVRYGKDINGGAETHCRSLAERLTPYYNVEVLTTCIKDYKTCRNELPEGIEILNNVTIRHFLAQPINAEKTKLYQKTAKIGRKIRRTLFQLGILQHITNIIPNWTLNTKQEIKLLKSQGFYSPSLFSFINENKDDYSVFIFITYSFPLSYFGIDLVPEKSIFIPTAHNESSLFRSVYTKLFHQAAHIAFNSKAEQSLCKSIFGKNMAPNSIVSVGIETEPPIKWSDVKNKYQLPENYIMYLGRVDKGKINTLIENFLIYKKKYGGQIKLVLTGGIYTNKIKNPDIIYTGFVNDNEKTTIIQQAKVIINPSKFESLSLILLEAMYYKKPVLVNGNCSVLKEHCILSNYASIYYTNKHTFISQLHKLVMDEGLRTEMGIKGFNYVKTNYDWNIIINRLISIIESI